MLQQLSFLEVSPPDKTPCPCGTRLTRSSAPPS